MAREQISYDDYKVKAFLDTNIILECRPLSELPWHEVDSDGPILALMTPTAIKEVDSKKQDGRIGKRAREFNRLIAPVAAGGPPVVVRESSPSVELALSHAIRIPWDQQDDLDPDDSDSRIVAEALYAKDMTAAGKLLVSQDIKPIAFASNYDMATLHVSESWLHPIKPHPKDREIQKLNHQLAQYRATEPKFVVGIELIDPQPVALVRIEDLSDTERANIQDRIHALNPPETQARDTYGIPSLGFYDHSYGQKYKTYRKRIPNFMASYEKRLERLFNQARIKLKVENVGYVQAENLLIEIAVANGWLHDRLVFVSPQGPKAPRLRRMWDISIPNIGSMITPRVGRHEFEYKEPPNCSPTFAVTCEDFRYGQEYIFEGVVSPDVRAGDKPIISVVVTASNFRGTADYKKSIERTVEMLHVSRLRTAVTN